ISLALTAMSAIGVAFSAWLTYLELYVIGAVCRYCVVSAVIVTVVLSVSIADLRHSRGRTTPLAPDGE
ncbi:MAG: vitamin K epoxide reductase family protein, partial [Gemmatimonadaceae bacterium]